MVLGDNLLASKPEQIYEEHEQFQYLEKKNNIQLMNAKTSEASSTESTEQPPPE